MSFIVKKSSSTILAPGLKTQGYNPNCCCRKCTEERANRKPKITYLLDMKGGIIQ